MKVLFISSGNRQRDGSSIIKNQGLSLIHNGVDVRFFLINGKGLSGYLRNIKNLRGVLKNDTYDLVHAHYGLSGIVSLISRKKEAVVISFMGDDILGSEKKNGSKKWTSLIIACINKWMSYKFYSAVIIKSPEMRGKFGKSDKFHLIPNGVDVSVFRPMSKDDCRRKLSWSSDKYHILFPSDPERPEKNFSLLKEALVLINLDKGIEIHALHNIKHEEIPVYMNASDVLVLSSLHEGSPNVIKEAMSCNCPVVSTRVGDADLVIGNTEGCYISSFMPDELAKKIKQAIQFSKENGKTTGRIRIAELGLDSESIAIKIINVYKGILQGSKKLN